jgi:hypothetical protein
MVHLLEGLLNLGVKLDFLALELGHGLDHKKGASQIVGEKMQQSLRIPESLFQLIPLDGQAPRFLPSMSPAFGLMNQNKDRDHREEPGQRFTWGRSQDALIGAPEKDRYGHECEAVDVHQGLPIGVVVLKTGNFSETLVR